MTALAASLVLLAVSTLFAATSACGGLLHATTRRGRAAIRRRRRCGGLAEYVAACDRSRSDEPPWWPEFERQFRRECRRHDGARRPF